MSRPSSDHDMLTAALAYAERAWPVFPLWWPLLAGGCSCGRRECENVGKHPIGRLVPNGLLSATTDGEVIRTWWARFPSANVAIRTGEASGLVVLDVDGEVGAESLRGLEQAHGRLEAVWVRTGSGGLHAYMAHPGGRISNTASRLAPGLDVRGDGGYVAATPSVHRSRRRYRWESQWPVVLPAMAPWLVALLRPDPPKRTLPLRRPRTHGLDPYLAKALDGEAREVACAPAGQRNSRLNLAAWRLGRLLHGAPVETTVTEVLLIAACTAGLSEQEALTTIRSGLQAGERQPRGAA